ncbi:MAG: DUF4255 domain-containing protein [Pseudomonadota bacterium]
MALEDIGGATQTLQRLLELNIPRISDLPSVTVSTLPPERAPGGANVVNLYCYHVSEDPHTKLRRRQSGGRPVATSPLSLVLYYIVTAPMDTGSAFDALAEQRMLSLAMKSFHDFPVLDDAALVGTDSVMPFPFRGRDNRFEITMVQMGAPESLEFWAHEDQTTARPSADYEVRPVEIEPDPPTRVPGVVLTLGNFVFPLGAPQIAATEGALTYAPPAELGGAPVETTVSPARVGPINPAPPQIWNILRLKGASLGKGRRQTLLLNLPLWSLLYPDLRSVPVDMAQNAPLDWSQTVADGVVEIAIGEEIDIPRPDGTFAREAMYPGQYLASWAVELAFQQPDGTRTIEERSNQAAFSINPRITGFSRNVGTGEVTLDFGGVWRLNRGRPPPAIVDPIAEPELDILLSVDGVAYELLAPADPAAPGAFSVAAHQLVYTPTPEADAPGAHPVRVVVNGADSQPFWVEIP